MTPTHNLPNGPKMPVFLRLIKFVTQPVNYIEDLSKTYGDTFTVWGRNNTPIVYFSQPQALQEIFTTEPDRFKIGSGNRDLEFLLGDRSLLMLDGEHHQRQRQLLTPPFHGERMRAYGQTICEVTQQVTNKWKPGKPFNIRQSMQEISLRVILRVVFGLDEGEGLQKLRQLINSVLEFLGSSLMSGAIFFPFLQKDLGALSPWGRMLRQMQQIDALIYGLIEERRTEVNSNRQDILSLMMAARDESGQPMTDEELHDELMTLLIAGHETTASALTWAFYWLSLLPEVRKKLLSEIDTLGRDIDPNKMAKLPYLTAVCQETLRIYPIAMNAFPRIAKDSINIMGYELDSGTVIIPSIYLAHHREAVYPHPQEFRPERFLERQFSQYEYLPFGGGNRRCIGMAFAQYEMKLVLAAILSQFQVLLVHQRPVKPVRRGLTLAAPAGMRMVATSRQVPANITVGTTMG